MANGKLIDTFDESGGTQNTKALISHTPYHMYNNDHTTRTSVMKLFHLLCSSILMATAATPAVEATAATVAVAATEGNHQLCHATQNPII